MQGQSKGGKPAQPSTGGSEPRGPSSTTRDVNRERLLFCIVSMVGRKVTAKLRNNVTYEGLFHSCNLDGECSLTLKYARQLPSETSLSGEVIPTLIVPFKDFYLLSALDVPSPCQSEERQASAKGNFATDTEITRRHGGGDGSGRALVPWCPPEGEGPGADMQLGSGKPGKAWDQFEANEQQYGVVSTFSEDLYTTKLDPKSIPKAKREEAERIAREIGSGPSFAEVEGRVEGEDEGDEEARFSSVARGGRRSDPPGGKGRPKGGNPLPQSEEAIVQVPLTQERLSQHNSRTAGAGVFHPGGDAFALEHRQKRGMITAHSPLRPSAVSEMKGINALNLEPALPKLNDQMRSDWANFKHQHRMAHSTHAADIKLELRESLQEMKNREAMKGANSGARPSAKANAGAATGSAAAARGQGGDDDGGAMTGSRSASDRFAPKAFAFNANASLFTPSHAGSEKGKGGSAAGGATEPAKPGLQAMQQEQPKQPPPQSQQQLQQRDPPRQQQQPPQAAAVQAESGQQQPQPQQQTRPPSAPMTPEEERSLGMTQSDVARTWERKGLVAEAIEGVFDRCMRDKEFVGGSWPEASGPSVREVLGRPTGSAQGLQFYMPQQQMHPMQQMPMQQHGQMQQGPQQQGPQQSAQQGGQQQMQQMQMQPQGGCCGWQQQPMAQAMAPGPGGGQQGQQQAPTQTMLPAYPQMFAMQPGTCAGKGGMLPCPGGPCAGPCPGPCPGPCQGGMQGPPGQQGGCGQQGGGGGGGNGGGCGGGGMPQQQGCVGPAGQGQQQQMGFPTQGMQMMPSVPSAKFGQMVPVMLPTGMQFGPGFMPQVQQPGGCMPTQGQAMMQPGGPFLVPFPTGPPAQIQQQIQQQQQQQQQSQQSQQQQ